MLSVDESRLVVWRTWLSQWCSRGPCGFGVGARGRGAGTLNANSGYKDEGNAVTNPQQGANNEDTTLDPTTATEPSPKDGTETSSEAAAIPSSSVELRSLAPRFIEEQHDTYVQRLERAVRDPKNMNIALTGRYGAGKSSVLDKFTQSHQSKTLRLAISTLGPNAEGISLTNLIQKELVKQLVYSASPKTLRHSRFSRSVPLPWPRALGESVAAVALVGTFLALMDWLPPVAGTGEDHHLLVRIGAWAVLTAMLVLTGFVARLVTHDSFVVSDVSAGGATVKLSERTPTYFDEYLDDIVNYFDSEDVDVVIFEDLDRFGDPQIFEALRELNTLLNKTNARTKKDQPLRFVYAVRDSLFEKLGSDTNAEVDDAAAAETVRANRTKFFDIVIPLVPFISHRNARELLTDLLHDAGITGIDRRLVNLVAQHATDMRLLLNIRNEYLVFAERLLESDEVAPGLSASNVFALVAYKNFHLADFEDISRRRSDLDRLYDYRRELVRNCIADLERRMRDLAAAGTQIQTRARLARELGARLSAAAQISHAASQFKGWPRLDFQVEGANYTMDKVSGYGFWQAVAEAGAVTVLVSSTPNSSGQQMVVLNQDRLEGLVPEGLNAHRWADIDAAATRDERERLRTNIAFLRGADFSDLADTDEFTLKNGSRGDVALPLPETEAEGNAVERTFAEVIDDSMESELARALVKRGYLDRNFALYAAQFYGHFTGLDVANFMVQNVQTNTMEVDYPFTAPEAVKNLLDEADEDFTHTVAAYNIDLLNYLLDAGDPRATNVVAHLVTHFDDDARTFLTAYLTSGGQRDKLAARLAARPWRSIFTYLITDSDVPDDARADLVSSALRAVDTRITYEVGSEVGDFIVDHCTHMSAFTDPQPEAVAVAVAMTLERAEVLIPDLTHIDTGLRRLIVDKNRYQLTALNLRVALSGDGSETNASGTSNTDSVTRGAREPEDISLDRVRRADVVYQYCLARPGDYFAAVEQDPDTQHTVHTAQVLTSVLGDVSDKWDGGQVAELITRAAPSSRVARLDDVPATAWPALADANLFDASLTNLEAYRAEIGVIDEHLAGLLENVGAISVNGPDADTDENPEAIDARVAAIAVLNAPTIPSPATRVVLANSLGLKSHLPVANITPEPSELFALLLEHDLVDDEVTSFTHFRTAGWDAIGPAIAASQGVTDFLTPDLVDGMVADLLTTAETRDKVGGKVVDRVNEFIPNDDSAALTAVAQFAEYEQMSLPPDTIVRAAQASPANKAQLLRLLRNATPAAEASDVVNVFVALGGAYAHVTTPGAKFTVPYDTLHEELLRVLDTAGRCTFRKKTLKELYEVQVA